MYRSVSLNDPNFEEVIIRRFERDGLAVITDVFTGAECENWMDRILDDFENLGSGIDKNNIEETWTTYNLPPQTRSGLFQCLVSNFEAIWEIRAHPHIKTIFKTLYDYFKQADINDYIVSGDGINFKPGFVGSCHRPSSRDWAHLDQAISKNIFKCIQGQAILTNTSASFRATPSSHKCYREIIRKLDIEPKSNWLKFSPEQLPIVQEITDEHGCNWQIPILAPKGSVIVWASTLIHSAKLQDRIERPTRHDKYNGWRGVVYVCYRPREEFTEAQIKKRKLALVNNRHMNHWSLNLMNKKPGSFHLYQLDRHPEIKKFIDNPELVYDKIGAPVLTKRQKKLIS